MEETLPGGSESTKIGSAGPPHKTATGWVLFYHGVDASLCIAWAWRCWT